jgi:polyketide cyclase/dehydrase/lipid transport protein
MTQTQRAGEDEMSNIQVEASRTIDAPAEIVYQFFKDYRERHPSILPPAFHDYGVEEGGDGAGTVFHVNVRAGGRDRAYRMRVSEPNPGHVLQEKDIATSLTTTFTVTPVDGGARANVRIATQWSGASGIGGFMERTFAPGVMRRIYTEELDRLAAAVKG